MPPFTTFVGQYRVIHVHAALRKMKIGHRIRESKDSSEAMCSRVYFGLEVVREILAEWKHGCSIARTLKQDCRM